jgi:hypothetical protein
VDTNEKDYYSLPGVSNSSLKLINPEQGGSPRKFRAFAIDRTESVETPSLRNGKLIHLYAENPEMFKVSDITKPSEMLSSWVEDVYNECPAITEDEISIDNDDLKDIAIRNRNGRYKNLKDESLVWSTFITGFEYLNYLISKSTHIVMDRATFETVSGATRSLTDNDVIRPFLFSHDYLTEVCYNELPVQWDVVIDIDGKGQTLNCKSLIDRLVINLSTRVVKLIDLKTTSKSLSLFKNSFEDYHYYRQLAFYQVAVTEFLKATLPDVKFDIECYIVAVETIGQYESAVFRVSDEYLTKGDNEVNELLSLVGYHYLTNNWINTKEELLNNGIRKL